MVEITQVVAAQGNERTYVSYMKAGMIIAGLALYLKEWPIALLSLTIAIYGGYEYYRIATAIENKKYVLPNKEFPLIFAVGLIVFFYYKWVRSI